MAASGALELGRSAAAAGHWREACQRFSEARAANAQALTGPDLELLATASFLRGRQEAAFDALTTAHESYLAAADLVGAARTAGWLALELLEVGEVSRCAGWVARGARLVEQLEDDNSVSGLVALVPAYTAMFVGDAEEAIRRFEEIGAIAERTGDRELAAYAAFGRGTCLMSLGRTAEGFESLDRATAALTAGEASAPTIGSIYRVLLDLWHGAFDLARAHASTAAFEQWCRGMPDLIAYKGQSHAYRAQLCLLHGDWAQASAEATLAEECLRAGDFAATYVANYQLAELHRLRGEVRAAEEHYDRAAQTGWQPQPGLALLNLAKGEAALAQTQIRHTVAGTDHWSGRRFLPALVEIEIAAGDVAAARQAADELTTAARSTPTPMLAAVAALADARVRLAEGDRAGALEQAETASSGWSALNAPYETARCSVVRARALLALGDTGTAADELDAARAVFLELGARSALSELTTLSGTHPAGVLTSRELEVLRLVSTGLTNRGIAGRLSLSEKTVARHLSNIFGKLGLSSRAAATAYAYENGLI